MKQEELTKSQTTESKELLCNQLEQLVTEVNELAFKICAFNDRELNVIWSDLANARAYLSTALNNSRQLKSEAKRSSAIGFWEI